MPLPRSRKVRALLAFLALSSSPPSRSQLCDLLWDVPNDPRGELRWCLSRLRSVLDDPERPRVLSTGEGIALDLSDCLVDAVEIDRVAQAGLASATRERLLGLRELCGGDLLDGLVVDSARFTGWLTAQRQRYRGLHADVLCELARRAPLGSEETFRHLDEWLQVAPFDRRAHERLLDALVTGGRLGDAERHVTATIRSFEAAGLDWSALREAWQTARTASAPPARLPGLSVPAVVEPGAPPTPPLAARAGRRASVAIMPFVETTAGQADPGFVAAGITDDVITRLARLRALFVIARGTVYALRERGFDPQEAGRLLNVEYVVSGSLRREGGHMSVAVELAQTEDAHIVWTEELGGAAGDTFSLLDTIVDRIVAAIAGEIERAECHRALLVQVSSLDAWQAYHRGLWHMYKFNAADNRHADQFFRRAIQLDPMFARAHACLSFTHFQNAFLTLTPDPERQIQLAFETASHSLAADERDPAAHWAMGRALWLRYEHAESCVELARSIELSPNFALGHYTLGFVQCQSGDPHAAIEATNYSRQLSPFDPLQFGMLASRAMAHVRLNELPEATEWALKATARPGAHVHILGIAVQCLSLVNRHDEARKLVGQIRERAPGYGVERLLRAFHFDSDTEKLFRRSARPIGFDSDSPGDPSR